MGYLLMNTATARWRDASIDLGRSQQYCLFIYFFSFSLKFVIMKLVLSLQSPRLNRSRKIYVENEPKPQTISPNLDWI